MIMLKYIAMIALSLLCIESSSSHNYKKLPRCGQFEYSIPSTGYNLTGGYYVYLDNPECPNPIIDSFGNKECGNGVAYCNALVDQSVIELVYANGYQYQCGQASTYSCGTQIWSVNLCPSSTCVGPFPFLK